MNKIFFYWFSAFSMLGIQSFVPVQAINLTGTCDGSERCTIKMKGDLIQTSNDVNISSDNIIAWSITNTTSTGGVLLLSTNEDYRFLVKYFDELGNRNITQIGFYNFKAAQSFLAGLELISGLGLNHDQAGVTTFCTARGKDSTSGNQIDSSMNRSQTIAPLANAITGGIAGSLVGSVAGTTAAAVGGVGGSIAGAAIGTSPGGLHLKRNVVSDVRSTPSKSLAFVDNSFDHRGDCIDEPSYKTTRVTISNPIPITNKAISGSLLDSDSLQPSPPKPAESTVSDLPEMPPSTSPDTFRFDK